MSRPANAGATDEVRPPRPRLCARPVQHAEGWRLHRCGGIRRSSMRAGRVPRMPRWLRWKWGGGVVYAAASAGSRVTRSRSPYVSSCRPEEPHPMESEIRARSNSLGCPRLPRLTSPRAWWHQTSPTSPDDGGDFHTTRVGSERAHALLRQPRHGSRAWYCPFTLASGSDPRHESRVALLAATHPLELRVRLGLAGQWASPGIGTWGVELLERPGRVQVDPWLAESARLRHALLVGALVSGKAALLEVQEHALRHVVDVPDGGARDNPSLVPRT